MIYQLRLSMNLLLTLFASALLVISASAFCAEGMVTMKSPYDARQTMDRLETVVKQRGLTVFARIDHAAGASKVGATLRPTEVLIFGNPQGGTPFMACAQSVGVDLPLKALVWEDESSQVWLGYNDPVYLAKRHEVAGCAVAGKLRNALESISEAAISK